MFEIMFKVIFRMSLNFGRHICLNVANILKSCSLYSTFQCREQEIVGWCQVITVHLLRHFMRFTSTFAKFKAKFQIYAALFELEQQCFRAYRALASYSALNWNLNDSQRRYATIQLQPNTIQQHFNYNNY